MKQETSEGHEQDRTAHSWRCPSRHCPLSTDECIASQLHSVLCVFEHTCHCFTSTMMVLEDRKKIRYNDDSETGPPEDHLDMDAVGHHSPSCTMDHPHSSVLSSSSIISPNGMPLNPSSYHVDKLVDAPEREDGQRGYSLEGSDEACDEMGHSHHHTPSCSSSSHSPSLSTASSFPSSLLFPSDHVLSTPSERNSIDSAMQDDLYRQLRASLPPSASSPEPSILSSGSSTPRASDYYRWQYSTREETTSTSTTSNNNNTAATTPYYTTPSISSSSGNSSPERKHHRHQSSTLTSSIGTHALTSVIQKTSRAATSLVKTVDLHQAISISLYIFVTLLAGVTLVSILVAGYGLTLADDAKIKIGRWSREADLKRRRIMIDIEEWVRFANEQLKHQKTALEQGHYGSSSSTYRKRRASYPQAARRNRNSTRPDEQPSPSKKAGEALKVSSIRRCFCPPRSFGVHDSGADRTTHLSTVHPTNVCYVGIPEQTIYEPRKQYVFLLSSSSSEFEISTILKTKIALLLASHWTLFFIIPLLGTFIFIFLAYVE